MEELRIEIANIKNVHRARLSLPVEAGLYAIVGENATGKSTIMLALSQLVMGSSFAMIYTKWLILPILRNDLKKC